MALLLKLQAVAVLLISAALPQARPLALRPPSRAPGAATEAAFDRQLATALAGYAFDVYNDLPVGKASCGSDGTVVRFTSTNYVGSIFSGVLMVSLLRGELNRVRGGEDSLLERMVSGDKVDPYVELSCTEGPAAGAWRRAVDSASSSVRRSTDRPVWNETLFLYVDDPLQAQLEVRVMDKDTFKDDDFVGRAALPLLPLVQGRAATTSLPLPLYIDDPNDPRSAAAQRVAATNSSGVLGAVRRFFDSSRPRRLRTGTLFVDLQYIAFNASAAPAAPGRRRMPVGATLGLNWARLIRPAAQQQPAAQQPAAQQPTAALSRQRLLDRGFERVCSLENEATDTQAGVWADKKSRSIIVSFRGTETIKFRDILTDINLLQSPFLDSEPSLRTAMVHSGFLSSYRSVATALAQLLERLLLLPPVEPDRADEDLGWTIYITGHSLGGALATLLAFDISRAAAGLLSPPPDPGSTSSYDPYHQCGESEALARQMRLLDVHLCTFGAPRVGCPEFRSLFERLQRGRCYRVVNSDDIVARMPRGAAVNRLLSYEHVGKTVMIGAAGGPCWVEGESEGLCPLVDASPFAATELPSAASGLSGVLQLLGVGDTGAAQLLAALNVASDVSRGIDGSFLQREAALARSLADGRALESHLEPAYFAAFERLLGESEGGSAQMPLV